MEVLLIFTLLCFGSSFLHKSVVIGFQKWIGYSDVKSVPTYFYVQRSTKFSTTNIAIPFEIAILNIGGAFDLPSGIFTAPRTGTYFFSFIGLPQFPTSKALLQMVIALYWNGNEVGRGVSEEANSIWGQNEQLSIQSTLSLNAGDKIWVQIKTLGAGMLLHDEPLNYNHFSGWLLEEEFSLS
jgi:hypothetical protein